MTTKGLFPKIWRWIKKIFIILFIAQFVYIFLLKWINPPITITQFVSWISGHGLKRDYVADKAISYNAKLAVIASEDQLYADHSGFDWKSIKKAMKYNFGRFMWGQRYTLSCPVPAVATHLEAPHISPGVDWELVKEEVERNGE